MLTKYELQQARRCQEALMAALCQITRPGIRIYDADAGTAEPYTPGAIVFTGAIRVQRLQNARVQRAAVGEQAAERTLYACAVPWNVGDIRRGDVVHVGLTGDPALIEMLYVVEVEASSVGLTARRFIAARDVTWGG